MAAEGKGERSRPSDGEPEEEGMEAVGDRIMASTTSRSLYRTCVMVGLPWVRLDWIQSSSEKTLQVVHQLSAFVTYLRFDSR